MCERGRPQLQGVQCRVGRDAHLTDRACLLRVEFLGEISSFLYSRALLPLFPQPPSPTRREGGVWGVLKPKMREGTQELPKIYPCKIL